MKCVTAQLGCQCIAIQNVTILLSIVSLGSKVETAMLERPMSIYRQRPFEWGRIRI